MERTGKLIMISGFLVSVLGFIIWQWGDKFRFLGRLPGDIRIERENVKVFIPVTTMILVSILLSIILWLIQKLR